LLITITDEIEIKDCQRRLGEILDKQLTESGEFLIGGQWGTDKFLLNYNDKLWWYYYKWKDIYHQNLFGFGPPDRKKTNVEVVTLTIPLYNINRKVNGVFVKDTTNNGYFIMHRGGFQRRKKTDFHKFFKGKIIKVYDGDMNKLLYFIANISKEENIISDISQFMHEVIKFKNAYPIKK